MSNKDLIIKEISNSPLVKKEYKAMLDNIHTTLPAIKQSSSNFYKSHSQFMGVMLDVTAITPIRSVKHTLAEIDKTRMALEEAHLKMRKKDIELREKEHKLKTDLDMTEFEKELLETELLTKMDRISARFRARNLNIDYEELAAAGFIEKDINIINRMY